MRLQILHNLCKHIRRWSYVGAIYTCLIPYYIYTYERWILHTYTAHIPVQCRCTCALYVYMCIILFTVCCGQKAKVQKKSILWTSADFRRVWQSLGRLESPPPLNASLRKGCPFLFFLSILFVICIKSVHLGYAGIVFLVSEVRAAARAVQHTFVTKNGWLLGRPGPFEE